VSTGASLLVLVVVSGLAVAWLRPILRRRRQVRRLLLSEARLAKAVADGRVSKATGEMLLQHLEGLRRECSENNGS